MTAKEAFKKAFEGQKRNNNVKVELLQYGTIDKEKGIFFEISKATSFGTTRFGVTFITSNGRTTIIHNRLNVSRKSQEDLVDFVKGIKRKYDKEGCMY